MKATTVCEEWHAFQEQCLHQYGPSQALPGFDGIKVKKCLLCGASAYTK
jgi:hypothetical protein